MPLLTFQELFCVWSSLLCNSLYQQRYASSKRKTDEDSLDVFKRNRQMIVLGTRLTDRISNTKMYEKCSSIPFSRAIMRERLKWLGQVLQMKDDRLPKIVFFVQPSRAKRKASHPWLGWKNVVKKVLREMGTS